MIYTLSPVLLAFGPVPWKQADYREQSAGRKTEEEEPGKMSLTY